MDKIHRSKVVDLVVGEDGAYEPKRVNVKNKPHNVSKEFKHIANNKVGKGEKRKYILLNEADDFLHGVDAGLDFLDEMMPRVERLFKLRG